MRRSLLGLIVLCSVLASCEFRDDAEPSPQRVQRDSVRNSQRVTGQRAVGRALDATDTAAARNQRTDSILRQP